MTSKSTDSPPAVFKSGPLFISSKGIGWTSWKKRWFILTRTSLVFFRSDPSAAPQKGGEVNLTLGGIDLNNSASVEVKTDKKLLTVFFPDGRDGRAFTLKAETLEDLQEWKTALENALEQAPAAANNAGQNGVPNNEQADSANGATEQQNEGPPGKSMVIGRPILLALEDIDGSPSFLEKALKYIEDHGVRVEGILRQAADVEEVYRRVREFEQGKKEFTAEEDPHVIADCIKYILRELPSSPVPASCCNALLEAYRNDRNNRINAMRTALLETFPEPNRRLLQRILLMMQAVVTNKAVNRMSTSGVAACMSPLLLRPLLAGDCELEGTHMDVAGDGSFQLLQAAAAANHAQAIIITLLEEYDKIFGEGSMSDSGLFSDSDESGSGTEEASDDEDDMYEEDDDDEYHEDDESQEDELEDESDDHDETEDDYEHSATETGSGSGDHEESDSLDEKSERSRSPSKSPERASNHLEKSQGSSSASPHTPEPLHDGQQGVDDNTERTDDRLLVNDERGDIPVGTSTITESDSSKPSSPKTGEQLAATKFAGSSQMKRQRWGRTSAKKNLSMESIDFSLEEDDEIQRLESAKFELQNQIEEEANGNSILQANLERRKKALHERRLALEKDVARLQEQLQKERELRASLEAASHVDEKDELQKIALAEENFSNLKQRLDEIGAELNQQHEQTAALLRDRNIKVHNSSQGTTSMNSTDNDMKNELQHAEGSSKNEGMQNSTDGVKYDDDDRSNDSAKGQKNYDKDGADRDTERKNESSKGQQNNKSDGIQRDNDRNAESTNKNNDRNDTSRGVSSKFARIQSDSTSRVSSSPSRKFSLKGEGITSTTSALSKLTTRLNFLKERRNQIATELQSIDKGRGSPTQPVPTPGKGKGQEPTHTSHSPGKNQGPEDSSPENVENRESQSSHVSGKRSSTEGDNREKNKKTDNKDDSKTDSRDDSKKTDSRDDNKKTDKREDNKKADSRDDNKKSDKREDNKRADSKDDNKKTDKREDNNKADSKDDNKKTDNKDDNKKTDNRDNNKKTDNRNDNKDDNRDDNKKTDNRDDNKKTDNRDDNKKTDNRDDNKKNDNRDDNKKNDNRDDNKKNDTRDDNKKADNRDDNKKNDTRDDNRKTDSKDGNKKDSGSKPDADASSKQNQQQLDGAKSEGGKSSSSSLSSWWSSSSSSKNSDKGRRQDGPVRTLSR